MSESHVTLKPSVKGPNPNIFPRTSRSSTASSAPLATARKKPAPTQLGLFRQRVKPTNSSGSGKSNPGSPVAGYLASKYSSAFTTSFKSHGCIIVSPPWRPGFTNLPSAIVRACLSSSARTMASQLYRLRFHETWNASTGISLNTFMTRPSLAFRFLPNEISLAHLLPGRAGAPQKTLSAN